MPFLDKKRMHDEARTMLDRLGIVIADTRLKVENLSGGQRQSIAIGRAASFEPSVLIMDEPTAALAVAEVEAVLDLIRAVSARGVSVILITHRLQDLFLVCDRIQVMYEGRNVAERRIEDTSIEDVVNLIVGRKFQARSAAVSEDNGARAMSNPSTSSDNAALHPVAAQSRVRESTLRDRFMANGSVVSIAIFFLVVCLLFSVMTDAFLTAPNLLNIVRQSAPLLIVAAAMTFVITTGGIDLSVGSVLALVATLSAVTLQAGLPWPLVIIAMLLLGAAVGAIQGFFIAYERIPAFIVTLAGLSVIRGIALLITGGYSIPVEATSPFTVIGRAWFLGVPVPALIALAVLVVAYLAFNETRFGRYVTGIGANAEAVRRAGVDTRLTTLMVYVLSSTAAAAAGIILAARLGSGSSNAGQGFELEVIAAVVLGGTSLFGGRGTLVGTVLGAMTVAVIANGLILAHMSPFLTPIVTGTIILIAIWLNFRLFRGAIRSS